MGIYVDSKAAYALYKKEMQKPYFVDKSEILKEMIGLIEEGGDYICITRPRRFGKTVTANMIAAYFSRLHDAADLFDGLDIAADERYCKYRNQYPVIHISFNDMMPSCSSYGDYIGRIEQQLIVDLEAAFPNIILDKPHSVVEVLLNIYEADDAAHFIFVLDEWDFIFHQPFASDQDKRAFLRFLTSLLKDRPYVVLAYMTGILPIAKYSSGSELNMFSEFTMASEARFSECFGFNDKEVDILFERYQKRTVKPEQVTREGLRNWYDGYHTKSGMRLYNPRSVVMALSNNNLGSYWTSSGPYDEIFYYIRHNVDDVRDDLARMASGIPVPIKIREYAAVSQELKTKEEIFSAMVVYGFLSYENGRVCIPNKELMDKFAQMMQKENSLGYVYRLAKESERMLQATLAGDTKTMEEILEIVHDTEVPILSYNHETELAAVVNLIYLSARDMYRVEREDKAGKGYVDFIFYPELDLGADCIILELKAGRSPDEAVRQIKDRKYAMRFRGRIGEKPRYTGRILAVGISYLKEEKKHACMVEVL